MRVVDPRPRRVAVRSVLVAALACVAGLAHANDIQFVNSDPLPGGIVHTLGERYLLAATFTVVADQSGTYRGFAGTRVAGQSDVCAWQQFDPTIELTAGQPETIVFASFVPSVPAVCPVPHTSSTLSYCLHPPSGPGAGSVCREEPISWRFTSRPPPSAPDPYVRVAAVGDGAGGKAAAFDGASFLLAWKTASAEPRASRISLGGRVLDPAGVSLGSAPLSGTAVPTVSFDGTNTLVVWVSAGAIRGARIAPDGTVLDSPPLILLSAADAKDRRLGIAFDGANHLIAWRTSADHVYAARVSAAGTSLDGTGGFPVATTGGDFYPWVAYGGGQYLVTWHGWGVNGLDVFAARVTTAGTVLDPEGFTVFAGTGEQDHTSAASDGTAFLVAWTDRGSGGNAVNDGSAWAARVAANGTVVDDPPLKVSDYARSQAPVATTYADGSYLVAWQVDRGLAGYRLVDVFARRVTPAGVVDGIRVPLATGHGNQFGPIIAAGRGRYLAAWTETNSTRCSGCLYARTAPRSTAPVVPAPAAAEAVDAGWTAVSSPAVDSLNAIWAAEDGTLFAVGETNELFRYDGSSWAVVATLSNLRTQGVGGAGTNVFSVGASWDVNHYDGAGASSVGWLPPTGLAMALWADPLHGLFTVGSEGVVLRYLEAPGDVLNPAAWGFQSTGVKADLRKAWSDGQGTGWVVGDLGTVLRMGPGAPLRSWGRRRQWARQVVTARHSLNGVWGAGGELFVVGDAGTILHREAGVWTRQASGTDEDLLAVFGASADDVDAVGSNGIILHYDGAAWTPEASGTTQPLHDVVVTADAVWAVGGAGTILMKPLVSFASVPAAGSTGRR